LWRERQRKIKKGREGERKRKKRKKERRKEGKKKERKKEGTMTMTEFSETFFVVLGFELRDLLFLGSTLLLEPHLQPF
jgi:hypothetical protein